MSILYKYIVRESIRFFMVILMMVVGIYLAVDFFEKIDDFIEAGLPVVKAFSYFFLKIPFIVTQITPVGILLSVLVVFGIMAKNNEMVALKSSGISVYYLLVPVFFMGFLASVFLFAVSEVVVPITMDQANYIWRVEVRQETAMTSKEKNIWIKGNRRISHIKYYDRATESIFGITDNGFDQTFKLIRRVDAAKGVFQNGEWTLHEVMEQQLDPVTEKYRVTFFEKKVESLPFTPEDLKRVVKKSEEMSLKELYAYTKKVEAEGYDATLYWVDLHAKIAFPFVCIVMCMAGVGIALKRKVKEALPLGIAYGIGIAFSYWIFYSFCLSLGYGEMLPPVVAVWTANFVFFCFSVINLVNAD
jgi:lipopolysaccharide export system permease protein